MISATNFEKLPIRVGLGQFNIPTATGELLQFIKQCGVDDVQLNRVQWSREDRWEYEDLASLRKMIEDY